jgi:hypothetical protein
MDIPEQHKIKTIFTSSTKLNTLQLFYNNKNLCSIAAQNLKTSFTTLYGMLRSILFTSSTKLIPEQHKIKTIYLRAARN